MDTSTFWTLVEDTRAEAVETAKDSVVAEHVATLTAALEPAPPIDESDTSSAEVAEEEPPSADPGGCGGCAGSPSTSGDLWLVLAILWALRPRRSVS